MASFKFKNIYLSESSTISGINEKINTKFSFPDYFNGEKTSEDAEVKMQSMVIKDILKRNSVDLLLSADLSNQIGTSNKTASHFELSHLGLYSACASYAEGLIVAGSVLSSAANLHSACVAVSSHNLAAERTFRYPIEYGSPRRVTQTFTATGAVASVVTKNPTSMKIESATIGKVIDFGVKDANNMGAIMAPSAAETIMEHFNDTKRSPDYYDVILTGDLGKLGSELMYDILAKNDITLKNHIDAGSELIVDKTLTDQGASGPVCLPLYLVEKILKDRKYKKVLIIGTGALQNQTLVNQKKTLPSVSHAVSIEVIDK